MEFYYLIIIFILFYLFFWKETYKEYSQKPRFEDTRRDSEVQNAIRMIQSSWDIATLQKVIYHAYGRFPEYSFSLSRAYNEQLDLLIGLQQQDSYTLSKLYKMIQDRLKLCKTLADLNAQKIMFHGLILNFPRLNEIFESYRLKLQYPNKATTSSKNLFDDCNTLGDIKKRFRRLAFLNHPDRGGTEKAMKEILKQYHEVLVKHR